MTTATAYYTALGLTPWTRRHQPSARFLILEDGTAHTPASEQLLTAMLKSIGLTAQTIPRTTLDELTQQLASVQPEVLLVFGDIDTCKIDTTASVIKTCHPVQLMQNSQDKRQAYLTLRRIT